MLEVCELDVGVLDEVAELRDPPKVALPMVLDGPHHLPAPQNVYKGLQWSTESEITGKLEFGCGLGGVTRQAADVHRFHGKPKPT